MERLAYLTQGDTIGEDDLAFILSPTKDTAAGVSMDLSLTEATHQFSGRLHSQTHRSRQRKYERRGTTHGAPSVQPLPKNATARNERRTVVVSVPDTRPCRPNTNAIPSQKYMNSGNILRCTLLTKPLQCRLRVIAFPRKHGPLPISYVAKLLTSANRVPQLPR